MSKTNDLIKLVNTQLETVTGATFHREADPDAVYPYKVFELERVTFLDSARDDYDLVIDIWDRGVNRQAIENIADQVEALFNSVNLPQATILPTFFRDSRYPVPEADKQDQHIRLHFMVENYERS